MITLDLTREEALELQQIIAAYVEGWQCPECYMKVMEPLSLHFKRLADKCRHLHLEVEGPNA